MIINQSREGEGSHDNQSIKGGEGGHDNQSIKGGGGWP